MPDVPGPTDVIGKWSVEIGTSLISGVPMVIVIVNDGHPVAVTPRSARELAMLLIESAILVERGGAS